MIPKQSKLGNWKHNCTRNSTNNAKKKKQHQHTFKSSKSLFMVLSSFMKLLSRTFVVLRSSDIYFKNFEWCFSTRLCFLSGIGIEMPSWWYLDNTSSQSYNVYMEYKLSEFRQKDNKLPNPLNWLDVIMLTQTNIWTEAPHKCSTHAVMHSQFLYQNDSHRIYNVSEWGKTVRPLDGIEK